MNKYLGEETLALCIMLFLLKTSYINFSILQWLFTTGYYCGIYPMVILYFPHFFYI